MRDIIRVSSKAKAFEELGVGNSERNLRACRRQSDDTADASAHGQNIAPESSSLSEGKGRISAELSSALLKRQSPKATGSAEYFNFSKFYFLEDVKGKIVKVANLDEAAKSRNKGVLVLPGEYNEDIGLMKKFAEGNSAFLIDLSRVIETYGFKRAVELAKMRRFLRICIKYEISFALASFAKDEFSIRTSRELCHIATLVGLNVGQAKFGLERLKEYLE